MDEPRHPVGPEIDDTSNPTAASPEPWPAGEGDAGSAYSDPAFESSSEGPAPGTADDGTAGGGTRRPVNSREMLTQLQAMIDSLAVQATPVVRDVAAKAAELAAIAAEKAGPLAHRAAEATERVGGRVAARSKEVAADLRRTQADEQGADPEATAATDMSGDTAAAADDQWPPRDEAGQ